MRISWDFTVFLNEILMGWLIWINSTDLPVVFRHWNDDECIGESSPNQWHIAFIKGSINGRHFLFNLKWLTFFRSQWAAGKLMDFRQLRVSTVFGDRRKWQRELGSLESIRQSWPWKGSEPNGSFVASCFWDIWDFARVECCLRLRPGVVLPFFKEIASFSLVNDCYSARISSS